MSQTSLRTVRSPQRSTPRAGSTDADNLRGIFEMKHLLHGVALAVLTTTCAQAAYAQDAAATGTPSEGQAGSATQPAAGQAGTQAAMADPPAAASPPPQGLGAIVVTAQ